MEEDKQVQNNKPLTKKEKADAAGRDVAEVAARGAGRYFGGTVGGAAVDVALQTKAGQKIIGRASKVINKNPITRNVLANNQGRIGQVKSIANSLVSGISNSEIDSLSESYDDVDNNVSEVKGTGVVSGLWKKLPLKAKLVIIGVIAAFCCLLFFLVIFITPLMELEIIDIKGSGSSSLSGFYVNPSYAYCESINVDGSLYDLEDYVAGVVEAEVGMFLSSSVDEALKAYAIQARTYALYNTNGCKKTIQSGSYTQNFNSNPSDEAKKIAEGTKGIVLKYNNDLFNSKYDAICDSDDCFDIVVNENNSYSFIYESVPSGVEKSLILNEGDYIKLENLKDDNLKNIIQMITLQYASEGKTYEEILDLIYSDDVEDITLKKLLIGSEGSTQGLDYIGTYTNAKNGKTYKNYKQYLYRNEAFTFQGSKHLASVGCGTNSTAIILSGEDSSITPQRLYIENGYSVGTYFGSYYPYKKESFNYCDAWSDGYCLKTKSVTKLSDIDMRNRLVTNLMEGGTAILFINYISDKCLVNGESWTGSQHYFTALDYNQMDNTIYISNPGTNASSQNGWISLDRLSCVHVAWLLYSN